MKPSFHVRQLNGPFDDPGLFIRVIREGRALMFDLGFTTSLSPRDILKTGDIFVSHTHVDHFIGFDNILRICLKRGSPLKLYGPKGFIDRVDGKLRGYTWNIVEDYPLVIEVFEINEYNIKKAFFKAANAFVYEDGGSRSFDGTIMKDSFYSVSAAIVDHEIPCLAFSLEEDSHINIDKAKLNRLNLPVGPWLRELKMAIRRDETEKVFIIENKSFKFEELKDITSVTKGQKVSYVVDAVGSDNNVKKIVNLVKDSDVLFIETYFLDKDKDRAIERQHLTAKEAGRIARNAGVGRVEAIHFSPRYMDNPYALIEEALEEFNKK